MTNDELTPSARALEDDHAPTTPSKTLELARALLSAWEHKQDPKLLQEALCDNPDLSTEIMRAGLLSIYMHMYDRALTSKTATWTELFLKRFDPEFKTKADDAYQRQTQINIFGSWTTDELKNFVKAQSRKVLGEAV